MFVHLLPTGGRPASYESTGSVDGGLAQLRLRRHPTDDLGGGTDYASEASSNS